ncbi:MAG: hypothetical protein WC742_14900 [Gallionellaceae bacterium]
MSLAGREERGLFCLISRLIIQRSHHISFRFVVVIGSALPRPMVETDDALTWAMDMTQTGEWCGQRVMQ